MSNLMEIVLTVVAFAIIFGVAMVVKSIRRSSREEAAPFRHYFEFEYDRSLIPQSSWSDDEDLYHRQIRTHSIKVRDSNTVEQRSNGGDISRRD